MAESNIDNKAGVVQLKSTYRRAGIDEFGLYLGAGINSDPQARSPHPRASWPTLLKNLYCLNRDQIEDNFETLIRKHQNNWAALAEDIWRGRDIESLVRHIDFLIHEGASRGDKDRRLNKSLLDTMPTLHAAVCFSAQINDPTANTSFRRNPRIGSVITINYDFFFGAAWTRYQSFPQRWKVQTPFSRKETKKQQRNICYIHGYIPYNLIKGSRIKARDLVLTRSSYEDAYAEGKFARQTLWEAVQRYNLIFLGTSFTDDPLCEALAEAGGRRKHFAVIHEEDEKTLMRLTPLPVVPVTISSYEQIPELLQKIYCAGLNKEELERVGHSRPIDYWEHLENKLDKPGRID